MRHSILCLIAIIAALVLAACGGAGPTGVPADRGAATGPTTEAGSTAVAGQPTEAVATEEPAATATAAAPTDEPTEAPATEAPSPTPQATAEPAMEPATTADSAAAELCPDQTADTYLLINARHGYCLLYPDTHKVERPSEAEVDLVIGGLLNATDPRASIRVEPAEGRTAAEIADQVMAGAAGFEIDRMELQVAGEQADLLVGLPGQDINRQLWFVHQDRLFHFMFMPDDLAPGETQDELTAFSETLLNSLTFIPVSEAVTAAEECVAPHEDQQAIFSQQLGFCFLVPVGFSFEQPSETGANLYVGSMMDVENPKLMIEVADAKGQTAAEAAEALLAEFPDMGIERSFGDTLGYVPAERLDGVPGQDLGRVLLAARDNRLYRLTFVPADSSQAEVFAEMEELFALVLNTFRFIP